MIFKLLNAWVRQYGTFKILKAPVNQILPTKELIIDLTLSLSALLAIINPSVKAATHLYRWFWLISIQMVTHISKCNLQNHLRELECSHIPGSHITSIKFKSLVVNLWESIVITDFRWYLYTLNWVKDSRSIFGYSF